MKILVTSNINVITFTCTHFTSCSMVVLKYCNPSHLRYFFIDQGVREFDVGFTHADRPMGTDSRLFIELAI